MKDIGQRVRWGPEPILVKEGPPLVPLGEAPLEVEDGTAPGLEDSATIEEESSAAAV